jgi:L-histidine N-alpha-methyltransferase
MSFADEVRAGLSARPKTLPTKYLYDDLGSALFEVICLLPEYYLTRAEASILRAHARDIISAVGDTVEIVELGSGTAAKTRLLLDAALARQGALRYSPIDISRSALDQTVAALNVEYPAITVEPQVTDYLDGLRRFSRNGVERTLVLFLGSNVGNFEPPEAQRTLRAVRETLRRGDSLLVGADMKKDVAVLEAAYNDKLGVTAAFNKNLLLRINRELGGHFDLDAFHHKATYNAAEGRVEMHLIPAAAQDVAIDELDMTVHFEPGESIHTESSYKYDERELAALASATGFDLAKTWSDTAKTFTSNLLVAR